MKVTRSEVPGLFENIREVIVEDLDKDHRRGANFFVTSLVSFEEEYAKYYPDVANFSDYVGLWKTNTYIWDDTYGVDWSEVYELTKVEKREVEKIIKVIEYVEV